MKEIRNSAISVLADVSKGVLLLNNGPFGVATLDDCVHLGHRVLAEFSAVLVESGNKGSHAEDVHFLSIVVSDIENTFVSVHEIVDVLSVLKFSHEGFVGFFATLSENFGVEVSNLEITSLNSLANGGGNVGDVFWLTEEFLEDFVVGGGEPLADIVLEGFLEE